ncbi:MULTISPECIES: hypothetical protein [unclassified Amycolatopsis]|uniref:hypothetical protein n=1 Tax=unclassified Amycolatopsis TaxID=2618356 RepID=UPI001C6A8A6F|nr:hypothetical protein [Amycolatopsis sp. DSM 110486]QYN23485.1 hypothetical protein K1T34_14125 [Amycolatopsis sp. DSM 110486]
MLLTDEMLTAPVAAGMRVQPVLVFRLVQGVVGPGVTALEAVSRVYGGVALLDDGAVTAVRLGRVGVSPDGLDLTLEAVLLEVDGQIVDTATGAAVGHPAQALAGVDAEEGLLVMTDGLIEPVEVRPDFRLATHFTHLGVITL